jgi:signal transduction histidine kinase
MHYGSRSLMHPTAFVIVVACVVLAHAQAESPFVIKALEVDGASLSLPMEISDGVRMPAHTRMLDIYVHPVAAGRQSPLRFRYQLEDYDREWQDPIGVMRFTVRFDDAAGNVMSGEEFDAHGESPGWTGSAETSRFVARRETLDVPAGASRLQVWLSSAGPQQTMGVYALDALTVTVIPKDAGKAERRFDLIPREGSMLDSTAGTPSGWTRHGTSLGIAQILPRRDQPPLIVMRDDRADAFGGWFTISDRRVPLDGAAKVVIEWKEAYSIGWGGEAKVQYAYLPVGQFHLRVQPLTVEGKPTGYDLVMPLAVVPPFHETKIFWFVIASVSGLAIAISVRRVTRQRMQRRLDALERERAVEHERSRIARDLHDNLGADLTHLALLSDLARGDANDAAKTTHHLDELFDVAQGLTRQVDEIVWAVNPANDSLKGFVPFLSNHAQSFLRAANIACRIYIPTPLPDTPLTSAQRHQLFLVAKETLHNIVKHAGATEVWLRLRFDDGMLRIQIEDNGRGVVASDELGNGTGNMQRRMADIGGSIVRRSDAGKGTSVAVALPLDETTKSI